MYLYRVRKSPIEGLEINLNYSQLIAVIILFVLAFVLPVLSFNNISNKETARVAGVSTNQVQSDKSLENIYTVVKTAAIGSATILSVSLLYLYFEYVKQHRTFEL